MNISNVIRQVHRWLSLAFTLGVILNSVVIFTTEEGKQPPGWIYPFALLPLFALLFSGLYLFFLPYVTRWRGARRAS